MSPGNNSAVSETEPERAG